MKSASRRTKPENEANDFDLKLFNLMQRARHNAEKATGHGKQCWADVCVRTMMSDEDRSKT